ncbi:hypothetical protein EVAR_50843_1 [Eumeta japonica]|uniref:Uncharacterized protein n=1 Tax=Eumeta variegata TaxID=151549 RepID=A0A4C1XBT5_EUMVA|nr:hypothetical protein EVAR_50843_1 [Eumeta japonica]
MLATDTPPINGTTLDVDFPGFTTLNASTFKAMMQKKRKIIDSLHQIEGRENQCTIVRTKNKTILLFSWEEKTPFSQACPFLPTLGGANSGVAITPRTITINALSMLFEIVEVVD